MRWNLAKRKNNTHAAETSAATVGYEAQLWQMADALRGSMDAAEYKHVVLGLIFLKYISDAFEEQHAKLLADKKSGADPEDPDEYRAQSIFWVPPEARWQHLKAQARQPSGRQRVQADSLAHYRLPRVPQRVAEAFGRAVKPRFARSSSAARESRTLASLRDTLLPKLIFGELRVEDADTFTERVVS